MLEALYRGLTALAGPAVRRLLDRRLAAGKEDPHRLPERLGHAGLPRPPGRLIWLHAASVGESIAVLPLIDRLLALTPRPTVLVTTGTVTSATLMAQRLPAGAIHQFVPVDLPAAVARFIDHWRPDAALWIESEFWPNLLRALRKAKVPTALVNARLSAGSHRNWRRAPRTAHRLLSTFRLALAQTATEAGRLRDLGLADVRCVGNLKYSTSPLPADPAALAALRTAVAGRPAWVFASTHPGEDDLAAQAHQRLAPRIPGLLTLVVPRHPARGPEIAAAFQAQGLTVSRRAGGALPAAADALHVADTLGELGLFFRLAPVAAVGGSFVPVGGHNPIEPAQLGAAIVYGPHMHNFAEIAATLEAAGGARRVPDGAGLAEAVHTLLTDPAARDAQAGAAKAVADDNRDAVDRVMAALAPLLAEAGLHTAGDGR
ncbi:3-deoxy-D-manno-octulosonic acid transferase [Nitrospirillum sp. BR 11164]|uniref:3-deoxy-D-manno-octulosonic acid transferase n=1 Tax=Nitrospirillum sp. BR 11164 TaxID=3104324 RepID=UPI002AFE327D|nr:3-deoxy-D-manno-octulosonic acid transferase [Nitrospirillum sp. BR 11164]MEA1650057.1 3-deoxy-D-manno-octulosonic acid transferase [Nitrospirillum sp. BR 11164]